MKRKMKDALRELKGNRGSGIVLVLVCMLCVSLLGVMILYLSYTGMLLKLTEREGKQNFYDASEAMDEIRAGVQTAASDSIAKAYKTILVNYNNPVYASDMSARFGMEFKKNLESWQNSAGTNLLKDDNTYDLNVLTAFASAPGSGDLKIASVGNAVTGTNTTNTDPIVLKNISVSYTDAKGYVTQVITDISVSMPDLSYVNSSYSASGLPEFALIAKNALKEQQTSVNVAGSAYAGEISAVNGTLIMSSGTVVCRTEISSSGNGSAFETSEGSTLWANRIRVGGDSTLSLKGTTYVQDDLDMAGAGSSAAISGSYFGFGNSATDSSKSSAILVNGKGVSLDLGELKRLMLAGHSFVENPGNKTSDILMGEAASVRGNQMAYLIPDGYYTGADTNPCVYSGNVPVVTVDMTKTLWSGKSLSSYGASSQTVIANYPGANGQHVAYFFIKFDTTAHANEYFKDYFSSRPDEIKKYLDGYLNAYTSAATAQAPGWTIKKTGEGQYVLGAEPVEDTAFAASSRQISDTFSQLRSTLFSAVGDKDNPYDNFVNETMIAGVSDNTDEFYDENGKIVGLIIKGTYEFKADSPQTLRVIVATGNVTINAPFTGLVISGDSIYANSNITASESEVSASLLAKDEAGKTLSEFFKNGAANSSTTTDTGNSSWNLDKIVKYSNWKKT